MTRSERVSPAGAELPGTMPSATERERFLGQLINEWRKRFDRSRAIIRSLDAALDESEEARRRLVEVAGAVVRDWRVRGDGGCELRVRQALEAVLAAEGAVEPLEADPAGTEPLRAAEAVREPLSAQDRCRSCGHAPHAVGGCEAQISFKWGQERTRQCRCATGPIPGV